MAFGQRRSSSRAKESDALQIAASLSLPLTEIELLIKVHQIVLEQVS